MYQFKVQGGGNLVGASNDLQKVKGQKIVTFFIWPLMQIVNRIKVVDMLNSYKMALNLLL